MASPLARSAAAEQRRPRTPSRTSNSADFVPTLALKARRSRASSPPRRVGLARISRWRARVSATRAALYRDAQGPRNFKVQAELVYAVPNAGQRTPLLNGGDLEGNVALFERGGGVPMVEKVLLAQVEARRGALGRARGGRGRAARRALIARARPSGGRRGRRHRSGRRLVLGKAPENGARVRPGRWGRHGRFRDQGRPRGGCWRARRLAGAGMSARARKLIWRFARAQAWRKVKIPAILVSRTTGDRLRRVMALERVNIPGLGEQWAEIADDTTRRKRPEL